MKITNKDQLVVGKTVLVDKKTGDERLLIGHEPPDKRKGFDYSFYSVGVNWWRFDYIKENYTIKDEQTDTTAFDEKLGDPLGALDKLKIGKDCTCKSYYNLYSGKLKDCTCGKCEEKSWPQIGDKYWYIMSIIEPGAAIWRNHLDDKDRKTTGNCFHTREECVTACNKAKEILNEKSS